MSDPRIRSLFEPNSVAVIGASSDPTKASGLPLRNIVNSKFAGRIYPVNPRAAEIGGLRCYPNVCDLPEAPDVAILMVDARLSPEILEECGRKGVKTAIIGSAGFSESGPEGRERQARLCQIAKQYDIRVCGPNCHGTFNVLKGIPCGYDHSFALPLKPGPVAIASHSGALLGVLGYRAVQANQGLSYLVSNGNEMDLDLCDFTEFFLQDDATTVVALLMEGLKDGPRFLALAERAHEVGKKIVVLKVGKSERGAITTLAHTARMAGSGEVYEAAFRQHGVISTDTVESFLAAAQMAAHQPVPRGRRILVMTSSGAGASLMADKANEYGLDLAEISAETQARIPQRRTAILTNPFDTAGASRSPGFLASVCEAFAMDPANDCLLMYLGPLAVRHEYARQFAAASAKFAKPAATINCLSEPDVRDIFQGEHIPVFDGATDACFKTLRAYMDYGQFLMGRRKATTAACIPGDAKARAVDVLHPHKRGSILPHEATAKLLAAYGFVPAEFRIAFDGDQVANAAAAIAYPVLLKGIAPGVAHRSEAGLVSGKVSNEAELQEAFAAIVGRCRARGLDCAQIIVERFVTHDFEVILGVKYDSTFGPVVLCGLGGIFTEVLRDYSLRLAPLARSDAEEMLSSLKAFSALKKSDDGTPHIDSLIDAILRLAQLAVDLDGKIKAVDINPIGITLGSPVATVLDAKIHL
ncbi:MAG TPA: acetate--CoA ligase family protein [Candidatus Binatia bacterium]|nr:acetate--CoA ligase family protein [Candidatus Binatia bacterium]